MNRNMFCIQKKHAIIGGIIIFLVIVLVWSRTIQESPKSYNSRAGEILTLCKKAGLYDIPVQGMNPTPIFVSDYYTSYCHGNEILPIWNGSLGSSAKCLTATLVCGSKANCTDTDCIMNVSSKIRCLYKEVSTDLCKRAGVVKDEQLQYVCMYAGQVVTADATKPYYYTEFTTQTIGFGTPINTTYKCIKSNGYNVGTRCITDSAGNIIANYNMSDETHCPLNAPQILVTASPTNPATTSSPAQPVDTQAPAQPQQLNCDINKFRDYNCGVEGWNVGDCKIDTNGVSRICGCDPSNPWISYPILYEVNKCPL